MRTITAKTFTPLYDEVEDRLRVAINYEDAYERVDFMITRAFIINILPAAEEFILKHYGEDEKQLDDVSIKMDNANSNSSKNLTKTDGVNLELYKQDDELLREVNFSYDAKSKLTTFIFSSKTTKAIAIVDATMLKQIFKAIKSAIPKFAWGVFL